MATLAVSTPADVVVATDRVVTSSEPAQQQQQQPQQQPPHHQHDGRSPAVQATKPDNALTPPTSEEMNHDEVKRENEDSELSDLDLDDEEDDGEDIEPDHYWDDGKIPVFKPTMEQFRSFKRFINKIDKYGMRSGIVKVIPPPEWRQSLPALDEYVKRIKIKNPITQEFNGTQGVYTQQNVEKQRSYNLPEWKSLTEETQHQPPAKRGERRRNQEKVLRGAAAARNRSSVAASVELDDSPKPKRKPGRPSRRSNIAEEQAAEDGTESRRNSRSHASTPPTTPANPPAKGEKKPKARPTKGGGAGQAKSVTSRRLNNTAEAADFVDEAAFKDFQYSLEGTEEYTAERCAELETHYWKSLGFNQPMYAADMPGSLFDDTTTSWNVAKLENLLDVLGTKVPGVNTAYLYMGMWKATFAWHLEDVDLYSINYIHFGAPKQWYSISQEDARKFEKAMKTVWPVDAKNCDQFLRHKTYLISPDVLQKQYGVKVNKLVHYEGEFVITFPYGYHSGYNIGYNCAESVNFATESWLEFGKIARKCHCESDNVWVDVFEVERKLRGEPTPEYIEETDDESEMEEDGHLPSPPASVKGKSAGRKRKRGPKQPEPKKKKRIRIKLRLPTREPCVMCPNDNPWEPLLPTDNGKKAHRSCVLYTPETWVAKDEKGHEMALGVTTIDRARLDLKCNFCRSKRGACFQCSSKKCTRAFHATCALAAGVQIDGGMVPTFGEDGTEYYEEGFDFRCRYHRPKMPKHATIDTLEGNKRVLNFAKDVKPKEVIQAQMIGGEVFAGLVVEHRPNEMTVVVDVLPDGERVEVEWKYLCVLDPEDSLRPKPTASAIPMPEGMNKKAVSISNRQDGVPTQDEPFHESADYKWHDFYNVDMPPPGYSAGSIQSPAKLDVKLESPNQLFYYLPTRSTEARCFFTDTPDGTEVCAMANFLELVQPPKPPPKPRHSTSSSHQQNRPLQKQSSTLQYPPGSMYTIKPYIYKPKEVSSATAKWMVDQQALANQRTFLADNGVGRPLHIAPSIESEPSASPQQSAAQTAPLRAFSTDYYYSTKTLPAAFPGEHSAFREHVRRESQGAQTILRPGSQATTYDAFGRPSSQASNYGALLGTPAMSSNQSYAPIASRPPSSTQYQSPYGQAATPATTTRSGPSASMMMSVPGLADREYLDNVKHYPYLYDSFMRRATPYQSPYSNTTAASTQTDEPAIKPRAPMHTPKTSISSTHAATGEWTPPSQMWGRTMTADDTALPPREPPLSTAKNATTSLPNPLILQQPNNLLNNIHSPSTAARDGAQARLLRDHGISPYGPQPPYYRSNVLAAAYAGSSGSTSNLINDPSNSGNGTGPQHMNQSLLNQGAQIPMPNFFNDAAASRTNAAGSVGMPGSSSALPLNPYISDPSTAFAPWSTTSAAMAMVSGPSIAPEMLQNGNNQ